MSDIPADTLLVELGCEELPPLALDVLSNAFFNGVCDGLEQAGIAFDRDRSQALQSPRRMSLSLREVAAQQADRVLERKGPAVSAAFDAEGQATAAARGFAQSVGQAVEDLERLETDKGEWLFCRVDAPGKPLAELLYPILQDALGKLPVPRPMRWSDHDFSFVRPVHWLLVMHGDQVLPGSLYGCAAENTTRGHRIHAPGAHVLPHADRYLDTLEQHRVLADPQQRRERIRQQAEALGASAGGKTRLTDELLDEVNNLVEWPCAVRCAFDPAFLEVPAEALIASMEKHQKFFPVLDGDGALTAEFIVIANIESRDAAAMSRGFERVITPRLADAQFFWQQDLKVEPGRWLDSLDKVIFQKDLGSVGDKTRRIALLSKKIAGFSGANAALAERAGRECKADLVSLMVGEFPELQGTMGGYYLQHSGAGDEVALAVSEHYLPRYAGDRLPTSQIGMIVALADRLDTLAGIFAVGLKPTGNKDPFALRRAALGVIRLLRASGFALTLDDLLALVRETQTALIPELHGETGDLRSFLLERLRQYLLEGGASTRQVNAVLAAPLGTLPDLDLRLAAVSNFMQRPEAERLVAANKRIGNILKKQEGDFSKKIDPNLFALEEEKQLFRLVADAESQLEPLFSRGEYQSALAYLANLRDPIDGYFDSVMVMDEDPAVRRNRLAQLAALKGLFDRVADFSQAD